MGYMEAAKIVPGAGKFANASGNLTITGPGIAYSVNLSDPAGPWFGIWNGEISGRICNVASDCNATPQFE